MSANGRNDGAGAGVNSSHKLREDQHLQPVGGVSWAGYVNTEVCQTGRTAASEKPYKHRTKCDAEQRRCTLGCTHSSDPMSEDPDLALVVAGWDALPVAVKAGILATVRAVTSGDDSRKRGEPRRTDGSSKRL